MKLADVFKNEKKRDRILGNSILFLSFELLLYIVYFETSLSINFKMISFILAGIIAIISIILFALGIGNKNKRNIVYGIEFLILAIFVAMAFPILAIMPAIYRIGRFPILEFVPFIAFLVYYPVKIIVMIKNMLKN
ncbi:MAG: hypothetical protein E7311_06360 [Clostridiales bacterium]|nr:hypothetical protein [Clostridiales bacterium]